MTGPVVIGIAAALAWLYLLAARGGFWLCRERLTDGPVGDLAAWPAVAAIVPARDEEDTIAAVIDGLTAQDWPGRLAIVVVDDRSSDRTRERALAAGRGRVEVVAGAPLAAGWAGKLWAQQQGLDRALALQPETEFLFLCDADIVHGPATLRRLVTAAERRRLDLVSLMARLRCRSRWERLLIPAYVFFFQKLYPFAWSNDPKARTAAAAGGCVLLRRQALARAGGLAAMRGALIDDCTLARAVKRSGGATWIGLADDTVSLRSYELMAPIWLMVARSAFTQLRHSGLLLLGTIAGMALVYLAGPLLLLTLPWHGEPLAAALGGLVWVAMAAAYVPAIRYHGLNLAWSLTLPLAALLYVGMTVDSARRHWFGRGSQWKGRAYGPRAASPDAP